MATKKVKVYIDADTKGLDRGLKGANSKLGGFGKKAIGAAAGFVTVGAALNEVKKSVGVVQTLAKGTAGLSRATGMETEEASRWVAVARSRGIESAKLSVSMTALSKQIRAAGQGSKESAKAFQELGVSQAEIKRGDVSAIIAKVSDGMAKMGPSAERTALASRLFGKSYSALLPLLADGSKNLEENLALSDKYGLTLSKGQAKAALEAAKNQREMNMAMDGLRVAIGTTFMPAITEATDALAGFIQSFRAPDGLGRGLVDGARSAIDEVTKVLDDAGVTQPKRKRDVFSMVMGQPKGSAKESLWRDAKDVFGAVGSAVAVLWPSVRQRMVGTMQGISGVIRTFSGVIHGDWAQVWSGLKQFATGAINTAVSAIRPGVDLLRALFGGMVRSAASAVSREARKMWSAGRRLISEMKDGVVSQIGAITGAGTKVARAARSGAASAWKAMYSVGGFLMDKIKDGLSAGISGLASIGSRIVSAIKSGIGGVISIPFKLFGKGKQVGGRAARGGMLGGVGLQDTVPVLAAPGEAFLTRHQQVPVEAALSAAFGMSLNDVFANRRPHSASVQTFGGGGKAAKKKTAAAVKRYVERDTLYDALKDAGLSPGKKLKKSVGDTPDTRIKRIDALLKRKGLSRDDRLTLLGLRADAEREKADAAKAGGEGGTDGGQDPATVLAEALAANTAAQVAVADEQRQNREFAQRMHTAAKGVTDTVLQGILDKSLGGQLSTALLTTGPRFAT